MTANGQARVASYDAELRAIRHEDFASMLEAVPGCYFMLGNGTGAHGKMLHSPDYDFNDELLVSGAALWGRMVERFLSRA